MQTYPLVAAEYMVMAACAAFAFKQGDRAERLGAAWFATNMVVSAVFNFAGLDTPVVHLVEDGIFAVGLLPMAMILPSRSAIACWMEKRSSTETILPW